MSTSFRDRLAVCSWSLQPESPQRLIEHLRQIGISRVQISLDPVHENPVVWGSTEDFFRYHGIEMVSGMFGTVGEDYSTIDSIRRTGGLAPDDTWAENWENAQENAALAHQLGLKLVTFHAGFLPHKENDPEFEKLRHRVGLVADVFAAKGIELAFETGQETADTLVLFLQRLGRSNVGVNFDPANMILYDKGNPITALRTLAPWVRQCHIKDANRTSRPGTWGEEVVAGTGQVDWKQFFSTLDEMRFTGWCSIEREAGNQRVADIIATRKFIESASSGN